MRIVGNLKLGKGLPTVVMAVLLTGFSATAQTVNLTDSASTTKAAVVKHIGTEGNNQYFQVLMDNDKGDKFSLAIKDEDGNTLFQEVYNDKKFDKKFQLQKEDVNDTEKLVFIIRTLKDGISQSFEISKNVRTVEYVTVNKL